MGLFKRMSDIISANLNDMAEQYEDPEKMLKQAVYEMESSIDEARRNVARSMASEKVVAKELAENQRHATQWQSRAEAAVGAGDDQLARKALSRKQEYEKIVAALADQHVAAVEASTTLRRQLDGMQAKLAEAKRRLGTLSARQKAANVRAKMALGTIDPQLNEDAFAKFDRMREKVEMAEAEAEALRELAGDNGHRRAAPVVEPDDVDLEVDAELRELKLRMKK
jgi:phage shock protein A